MSDQETRATAEVVETDDGPEVLPPTLTVRGDVPQAVREAVQEAVEAEPNACDEPTVLVRAEADLAAAELTASYNEQPVVNNDGSLEGWRAPYQAREDFEAALADALPDGWMFERKNSHATTFYRS
jgi:hypothetical protein